MVSLATIGRIRTPFATLRDCPRNGRKLDPAPQCRVEVDAAFWEGLAGIEAFSHLWLMYWLGDRAEPAAVQVLTVRPAFDGRPRGVFATRAPVRPNPIGLSVVALDRVEAGVLWVRYLDCLDGTRLLDIKPYLPTTDSEPAASMGWLTGPGAGEGP